MFALSFGIIYLFGFFVLVENVKMMEKDDYVELNKHHA
jgi:hypothetical protein